MVVSGLYIHLFNFPNNVMKILLCSFIHGTNEDQEGNNIRVGLFKILKS